MNSSNRLARVAVAPLLAALLCIGCLPLVPMGSVLGPGESLPEVSAAGWLNGEGFDPANLSGQVVVLVAFASW